MACFVTLARGAAVEYNLISGLCPHLFKRRFIMFNMQNKKNKKIMAGIIVAVLVVAMVVPMILAYSL